MSGNGGSSTGSGTSGTGDGFLASDQGGISQSGIITDIPSIRDRTGNWITFPQGTNMAIANQLINIYEHFGAGAEGTYGRTLDYIQREYWSGWKSPTQLIRKNYGRIIKRKALPYQGAAHHG